ncbi:MAG: 2-isopropylmalate synthase, partial [Nevskia sp.]|nr:2-isopropylmalate synthase [Nevskia sp.]
VFAAIEKLIGSGSKLLLYSVNAITTGTDSQGEVTVRLAKDGRVVNGLGADTDIIIASAKAYINAINRLEVPIAAHPQRTFEPVP